MRTLWRIAAVVTALAVGSLLLPVAINYATSQPLPSWLEPYRTWAWPAVGVSGLILIVLTVIGAHPAAAGRFLPTGKIRPGAKQRALDNIRARITEKLAAKLGGITRVEVHLEHRPGAVTPMLDSLVRRLNAPPADSGVTLRQAFDDSDGSLLLLGAPGSGKSTQLLELAADLADQASDGAGPIPVLLELGPWGSRWRGLPFLGRLAPEPTVGTLREWLLSQVQREYGIGARIARAWLEKGELALLLDGLDEVAGRARPKLIDLLNRLCRAHSDLPVVVASRTAEYQRCPPLHLTGAWAIVPLGREQIAAYLSAAGPGYADLRRALDADDTLWEIVDSPFWLRVLASVARTADDETLGPATHTGRGHQDAVSARRHRILDAYVAEALRRPGPAVGRYTRRQVLRWLGQFALAARERGTTMIASPPRKAHQFHGTVPARVAAPVLPAFRAAFLISAPLTSGVTLTIQSGALAGIMGTFAAAFYTAVRATRPDLARTAMPTQGLAWIKGGLAAVPLAIAQFALQAWLLRQSAETTRAVHEHNIVAGVLAVTGVVCLGAVLLPWEITDLFRALIGESDHRPRGNAKWAFIATVTFVHTVAMALAILPLVMSGVLGWTGSDAAAVTHIPVGGFLTVTGDVAVGVVVGLVFGSHWIPMIVLIAMRRLPVRADRLCRFAAAAGLLIPVGRSRWTYRFPHMIVVDYFAAQLGDHRGGGR